MDIETIKIYNYRRVFVSIFWGGKFERYNFRNNVFIFTVIWQARKNKRTIIYCYLRKKYVAKYEHILLFSL